MHYACRLFPFYMLYTCGTPPPRHRLHLWDTTHNNTLPLWSATTTHHLLLRSYLGQSVSTVPAVYTCVLPPLNVVPTREGIVPAHTCSMPVPAVPACLPADDLPGGQFVHATCYLLTILHLPHGFDFTTHTSFLPLLFLSCSPLPPATTDTCTYLPTKPFCSIHYHHHTTTVLFLRGSAIPTNSSSTVLLPTPPFRWDCHLYHTRFALRFTPYLYRFDFDSNVSSFTTLYTRLLHHTCYLPAILAPTTALHSGTTTTFPTTTILFLPPPPCRWVLFPLFLCTAPPFPHCHYHHTTCHLIPTFIPLRSRCLPQAAYTQLILPPFLVPPHTYCVFLLPSAFHTFYHHSAYLPPFPPPAVY